MKLRICLLFLLVIGVFSSHALEFKLGTNRVLSVDLPEGWNAVGRPTKNKDGTEKGFVLTFQPTNAVIAGCLIDFGYVSNGILDRATLQKDLLSMSEGIVPKSVEKKANLKEFSLANGYGAYCLFTDASLVGKPVPQNEFRVMGVGLIQPGNDILGVVSMMTNDPESKEFKTVIKIINSMKLKGNRPKLLLDERK